ncbi:Gamma1-adaptin brefeldin A resistance protein [Heterocephalus glaber]|uniref:Gamma1-adaptin brefeldin A resistance protein n=1 Tax=Heterocephalus glaber TaxID=10181 RepID=G5ASY8_HETGA|nr:Gamma1-adaptin brefeldin A resistance protein [Heterocephalus glaber]
MRTAAEAQALGGRWSGAPLFGARIPAVPGARPAGGGAGRHAMGTAAGRSAAGCSPRKRGGCSAQARRRRIQGSNPTSASEDSNRLEWENDFVSAEVDDNGNSEYSGFVNPVLERSDSGIKQSDADQQIR